jgi:hypothetical protein
MQPNLPSPDGLPSAGAPDQPGSGAGRATELPLEAPRIPIADLPWSYDDDRVVLLARDPQTLFVYWDIHPDTLAAATRDWSAPRVLLQLWAVGGTETLLRDLDVDLGWRGYYLYDCAPEQAYRVELLVRGPAGESRRLGASSRVVRTAASGPSAWIDDRFASVGPDAPLPADGIEGAREALERLHERAHDLSSEGSSVTGETTSSRRTVQGFGGRAWSGTIRK